ncbi:MAG: ribonucleotide reductase [Saccharopolyspora sp.]|uniref:ribonucleotide reductase n=1 Tax=Saccharopolyspora sp. TaxID=33915 RepID=UPI0025F167EE|nr:ribonucleotide reductase [Saccharopolyspora sp.]MBQ6643281.1 ribonucleotide reductase [Saccharopolyspora sp.]
MIAGYDHFVTLADSLQWDEFALDLDADVQAWPRLRDAERTQLLGLTAGFCIGENSVAGELGSFQVAAGDESMAAAFRAQERDEKRHARFFDRVAAEVAAVPGADVPARLDVLREHVSPEIVELFETRLPAIAKQLADDHSGLVPAVGLYHMILEGVVLLAAQHAMLDALEHLSVQLPGLHKGMELVLRDERWHIGFGSRVIQNAEILDDEMEELLRAGEQASSAWGELISPDAIEKTAQLHRRRLKAVNIKFW